MRMPRSTRCTGKPAPRPSPLAGAPYPDPQAFRADLAAIAHALASAVEAAVVQLAEPANHELGAPLNAEAERLDAPAAPEAPRAAPTRVYRGQAY